MNNEIHDIIRAYAGSTLRLEIFTELRHRMVCKAIRKRSNEEYLFYVLKTNGLYSLKQIQFCSCLDVMYCGSQCPQIALYLEIVYPCSTRLLF